jgi:uncharacterized membrane protein (DUF485 family)
VEMSWIVNSCLITISMCQVFLVFIGLAKYYKEWVEHDDDDASEKVILHS